MISFQRRVRILTTMIEREIDSKDKLQKRVVLSSLAEKMAVFNGCMYQLQAYTAHEIKGEYDKEQIAAVDALRNLTRRLYKSIGNNADPGSWLWILTGILDFIPDDHLKYWTDSARESDHVESFIYKTAVYFSNKKAQEIKPEMKSK